MRVRARYGVLAHGQEMAGLLRERLRNPLLCSNSRRREPAGRRSITQDEYDKKARDLKERQTEISLRIEQHQKGEGDFRTTLESLISLASRAAELFELLPPLVRAALEQLANAGTQGRKVEGR